MTSPMMPPSPDAPVSRVSDTAEDDIQIFDAQRRPVTRDTTWMVGLTPDNKIFVVVGTAASGMYWIVLSEATAKEVTGRLTDLIGSVK